jgi:hypothetical protein
MVTWNVTELAAWNVTSTVARLKGIKLVMGLRPGFIDSLPSTRQIINTRIAQFLQVGIHDVVFAFDDVPGAGTLEQMQRQRDLVNATVEAAAIDVWGVVPAAYYGNADVQVPDTLPVTWSNKLAIMEQIPEGVRFLLAGQDVNPLSFEMTEWPSLPGRELIFWDNDAAVDTSTRLPWGLPRNRDPRLFSQKQYILNLAFPPERVVHQVAAILLLESNTSANIKFVSKVWGAFLVEHGLITSRAQAQVEHDLAAAITADQHFDSIPELVAAYPSFKGVWR